MNDWLQDNTGVLIFIVLFIVIILVVIASLALIYSFKASKNLTKTNLKMAANVSYDSDNLGEYLEIAIFNNNYRDIVIYDFGFAYKNQRVSFIKEYSERRLTKGRVVCPARSSITYKVNPERIEKFVVSHNFNAKAIDSVRLFVTDSVGDESIIKDKALTRVFVQRQKARLLIAKRKLHEEKVQSYRNAHDGSAPLSDAVWRWFHRRQVAVPELINKSTTLIKDATLTPETQKHGHAYNPAPPANPEDKNILKPDGNGGYRTTTGEYNRHPNGVDTKDMKVTFLDLDAPLKSKEIEQKKKK